MDKCIKCGRNDRDLPNTWCRECVEQSRLAWENTKRILEAVTAERKCTYCENCGIPITEPQEKNGAYCDVCANVWRSLQRPYFQKLHRSWVYGQTV